MSCDNMGFVWAYFNGNSKDELVYTLAKGLHDLAEGLGIQIQVFHQRRRTDLGDKVADHLSKYEMQKVREIARGCEMARSVEQGAGGMD